MSRKSKRKPDTKQCSPPAQPPQFDLFDIASVGALGLYLSRFFLPAESAHLGETLWVVQLWLALATFVCFLKWRIGEPFTFDRRDGAVWILVLGHVIGALIVIGTEGQKRAAINMLWEWVAVGVAFSMLKERVGRSEELRRLLTGLVITLVVLAGFGLWQHYVWYPQERALLLEFENTPPGSPRHMELAERLGPLANTGDPIAAYVLRQRLMESTEPIGRFALANTLGGLLAAGLVLLCGPLLIAFRGKRSLKKWLCPAIAVAVVGCCLLLTKSRTAWVGLLVGMAVWVGLEFGRHLLQRRAAVIGGSVLAGVLVLAAAITAFGGLDRQVLTEAPKALKYRIEYWSGTWDVIQESPLLGIGPGNFRQHYLRYKLPESSEEILDPHNLFLEVWANGGLISLAGLVAVLLVGFRGISRTAGAPDEDNSDSETTIDGALAAGGLVACVLLLWPGIIYGLDWQLLTLGVSGAVAGLIFRWSGTQFRIAIAARYGAAIALGVHLLGQGGIAMPVVCLTLLLLLLPASAAGTDKLVISRGHIGLLSMAATGVAMFACFFTACKPVFFAELKMNVGKYEAGLGRLPEARQGFQEAAEADPLDPEPWQALAEVDFQDWQRSGNSIDFQRAMDNLREAIARDPHHPKRYWTVGQWEVLRFERTRDPEAAQRAVESLARAVQGYPNSPRIRADYALALAAAGRSQAARTEAIRVLELDSLNNELGHHDKVLDDGTRERLRALTGAQRPD